MFKNLIKWGAIILLFPILLIVELFKVLKEMDIEVPDADDVLDGIKQEMKQGEKPKTTRTKRTTRKTSTK
jgi:hypothetical protein